MLSNDAKKIKKAAKDEGKGQSKTAKPKTTGKEK